MKSEKGQERWFEGGEHERESSFTMKAAFEQLLCVVR